MRKKSKENTKQQSLASLINIQMESALRNRSISFRHDRPGDGHAEGSTRGGLA